MSLHTKCSLAYIMANPKIKVKRSSVEGKVPAVTQLERGELAVNSYDGKVYILKDQFSVGIATTTHTINPWNEPNGVGAGISYGGDIKVLGISTFSNDIRVVDDKKIQLGNSQDLEIYHDSSDAVSVIKDAGTGQLKIMGSTVSIRSANDAKAMAVFIPNGASSVFYSGSKKFETTSSGINVIGVTTTTGLAVAGVSTFYNDITFTGTNGNVVFDKSADQINIADNIEIRLGNNADAKLRHDGYRTIFRQHGGGAFVLDLLSQYNPFEIKKANLSEYIAKFTPDGPIELYHDNTLRFKTSSSGVNLSGTLDVTGISTFTSAIKLKADVTDGSSINRLYIGSGDDLTLFHDTANSYIQNHTGDLIIGDTNHIYVKGYTSDKSVGLWFNNGEKIRTTNTGINVTGNVVSDGLVVDGTTTLSDTVTIGTGVTALSNGNVSIGGTLDLSMSQVGFDNPSQIKLSNLTIGQHQNTGSYKFNNSSTGSLLFQSDHINFANSNGGTSILRSSATTVELKSSGTTRLATNGIGATVYGQLDSTNLNVTGVTTANVLNFGDSDGSTTNIAKFGSSGDFTIQHNPSFFGGGQVFNALTSFNGNLQIENRDTSGPNRFLFLKSNAVQLRSYTGNESFLTATVNQGVSLFYDNSEKFVTTNTGGTLTGTFVTDGLTVGNYDFPTVAGSEGLVLKVASDGNLEFGSGASGGVVPTEKTFTATQGQTVFTDTTDLPTYIQVFVNGIKIRPTSDFSKSGASITLVTAATAGDEIDLVRFD